LKAKDDIIEAEYKTVKESTTITKVNPTIKDMVINHIKITYVVLIISFALSLVAFGITAIFVFTFIGILLNTLFGIGGSRK